ncbi:MAG: cytochrome b5 domain-containing protein [Desulfobacterales bacterium]
MKSFSEEELAECNGKDGKPAYIAHKGKVYDVTASKMWKGGRHMNRHSAGGDLSADISAAPHDPDVLERYPQVGELKEADEEKASIQKALPEWAIWLLESNPFFRRHPHPMTVHFPIVFMLANPVFNLLFLATGNRAFETTAFHSLGGGVLFTVVAMVTGFITWWYNYMGRMMKPVAIKIPLSILTLCTGVVMFAWRLNAPEVMTALEGINLLYLILSLSLIPQISIIGWYGATMTFPLEE